LHKGVNRIIIGTAAIEKVQLVEKLCQRLGEGIIVGLDAGDGSVIRRMRVYLLPAGDEVHHYQQFRSS